ncbi:hypothetical protein UFOVP991_56 [uncultured Caudovirales phage]|uniref:Uncharacterized protein n=1 Tax=uncultured Caudovirales phage TaxID=2100421 RepID=A0A6J5RKI4_9CAUD|nr:hypothetical protein UFOVP991_56 [uncultured Caudovirales phage]CAB4183357.1 hypothetical protein UFOVP1076_56 [uncultured Caudovirales phage]CAB4198000.1 hypothetical protein UFOVP1314_39 [uncultured Caudovirales phage]CAB4211317.1 hypothetical protein UFOVP1427_31 [uncultured Caudovirales phage]CAB5238014.1 hypothetical protein UFOVP1523_35 [uncultured Caudovirales phage]
MKNTFITKEHGEIEVDFTKGEVYFKRDDLLATLITDEYGYWLFAHPLWLTQFRILKSCKPLQLDVQVWRTA